MPVKYTIKRNSLSAKWGVWATDTDAASPVENLVAELKTAEDAESYRARVEAGEAPQVVMDSLSRKKPKKDGGGLFGKLFSRSSNEARADIARTNNPVIEIQAARKQEPVEETETGTGPGPEHAPSPVSQRPSRFQVIEQPSPPPAPPVRPVINKAPQRAQAEAADRIEAEAAAAEPTTDEIEARKRALEQAASFAAAEVEAEQEAAVEPDLPAEPDQAEAQEQPVEVEQALVPEKPLAQESAEPVSPAPDPVSTPVEPVAEEAEPVSAVEETAEIEDPGQLAVADTAPPVQRRPAGDDSSRDSGLLVDWTFTPPPDVTPEEARASGMATAKPAQPETADPAGSRTGTTSAGHAMPASGPRASENGRMVVEVCVSNVGQESSKGDGRVSDKKYNSIASKEYTEVSKAYSNGSSPDHLREELTHLAAVCLAWAEAIEKRQAREKGSQAA